MIQETAHAALGAWESFYLIVGSAAAALTGLQFVVITLVNEGRSRTTTVRGIDTFSTPTIVHFCAALFASVTMCAPWPTLFGPAIVIGAGAVAGLIYTAIVVMRARSQTFYGLVAEDWIWHIVLPLVVYVAQLVAALVLSSETHLALFTIAGSTLLLVYIGIHNAWDTSTYMVAERLAKQAKEDSAASAPATPPAAPPAVPEPAVAGPESR